MATPVSVSFHTLGCKLNFAETSMLKQQCEKAGYLVQTFEEGADICVLNTCSVTDFADRKCRKAVRQALKRNPESKVVVVGCYAQLKPDEIAEISGVDLVLGAGEKFNLLSYLHELQKAPGKGWVQAGDIAEVQTFNNAFSFGDRTRSFLKVQDGCDYNCSFCTIPQARGKSRSDSVQNVISNVREIAARGVQEIVLTGVNLGDFRCIYNGEQHRFIDLIKLLEREEAVPRFRISSIEPNLCSDDIIDVVAGSKSFMPHFHMPLQSGSDKILALMRRRYRRRLYAERVARIKDLMPQACIGVDVIVGFPGEDESAFNDTKAFLSDLPVDYLHVFTYSERADTIAASMPDCVPMEVRRQRNEILRDLSKRKYRQFCSRFLNTEREVLLEKSKKDGFLSGFTDNYIKVKVASEPSIFVNELQMLKLESINPEGEVVALPLVRSEFPG